MNVVIRFKGGPGSGHHGHSGRPGKVGGSSGGIKLWDNVSRTDFLLGDMNQYQQLDMVVSNIVDLWDVDAIGLKQLADGQPAVYGNMSEDKYKEAMVYNVVRGWAGSSGGPLVGVIVEHVNAKLNIKPSLVHSVDIADANRQWFSNNQQAKLAIESLGDAIYTNTQTWFSSKGVTHVKAYRAGFNDDENRAYTSWSTAKSGVRHDSNRIYKEAIIPVERILSTPATGFGTLVETELVVLGGGVEYNIYNKEHIFKGGAGSGHFGHVGRVGQVGGSSGGSFSLRDYVGVTGDYEQQKRALENWSTGGVDKYLDVEYDKTQEYYRERGVDSLMLYRAGDPLGYSYTTDINVANNMASMQNTLRRMNGLEANVQVNVLQVPIRYVVLSSDVQKDFFTSDNLHEHEIVINPLFHVFKGGSGSGHFGHAGRIGQVGGSSSGYNISKTSERVWTGKQEQGETTLTKLQAGEIGEAVVMHYMTEKYNTQFGTLNVGKNNAPIDVAGDHMAVEVKTGISTNASYAQRWRATIGQPGKAEQALISKMTLDEKNTYNAYKHQQILARKQSMLTDMAQIVGMPVVGKTVGVILSPDGARADVFEFDGFHLKLSWSQYAVEQYYQGTYVIKT